MNAEALPIILVEQAYGFPGYGSFRLKIDRLPEISIPKALQRMAWTVKATAKKEHGEFPIESVPHALAVSPERNDAGCGEPSAEFRRTSYGSSRNFR